MSEQFVRPAPTAANLRADLWIGVVLFVGGVISAALSSTAGLFGATMAKFPQALVVVAVLGAAIAVRRRFPVVAATVVCVTYFTSVSLHIPEIYAGNVAMFVGIYTVGAWVNDRKLAFWSRTLLIAGMMIWLLVQMFIDATAPASHATDGLSRVGMFSPMVAFMLIQLLINIAYFGSAYYLGDRAYNAAIARLALDDKQRQLDAERERSAAQAVALDRVAIARELHDVVAHHVSAMGVQAGAARAVLAMSPDVAAEALRGIEQSARSAIDELHQLLETLRAPGDAPITAEAPSTLRVERMAELAERATEVGVPTTFAVVGDPFPLTELVQANLYRIAQEALTNARRHGGPDVTADVRLRYLDGSVELEVTNSGRDATGSRAGLGQLGMRERAAASGGTIDIGPRPRGGFLVRARIPVPAPALA